MEKSSRFSCPSESLSLKFLLKRTRKALWAGLVLAFAVHLSLTQVKIFEGERTVMKPLTTRFVKREPRLTKPLELKKRPRPKPRRMRRKVVFVKARVDRRQMAVAVQPLRVMESLARSRIDVGRGVYVPDGGFEPVSYAPEVVGAKEAKDVVDMSLEMLDIDALDTGRYKAMVIQNPMDKKRIKGYLHLTVVYSKNMTSAWGNINGYIRRVVQAMNRYTGIKTDVTGYCTFDSKELLTIPWVFASPEGRPFRLTYSESANLGYYLTHGGFLYIEMGYTHPWTSNLIETDISHRGELTSTQNMFKDALAIVGKEYDRDWSFEKLPHDHPIYHCYFDFDGPPAAQDSRGIGSDEFIRGIIIDGRLVAMIETGDYERHLNMAYGNKGVRHEQFLVNTVVFALIQKGSITQQVMDNVSY